jgi:hypothetical protein
LAPPEVLVALDGATGVPVLVALLLAPAPALLSAPLSLLEVVLPLIARPLAEVPSMLEVPLLLEVVPLLMLLPLLMSLLLVPVELQAARLRAIRPPISTP